MRIGAIVVFYFSVLPMVAVADVPTVGYLTQFYNQVCRNPNLGLLDNGVPNAIPSVRYTLGVVDWMNNNSTTYAADVSEDMIASVDYVSETLGLLAEGSACCPGGYIAGDGVCRSCGVWTQQSHNECYEAGVYRKNGVCVTCPGGYMCPADTAGAVTCGVGYWCADSVRTRCEYGARQCPQQTHTSQPDIIACDNTRVFVR